MELKDILNNARLKKKLDYKDIAKEIRKPVNLVRSWFNSKGYISSTDIHILADILDIDHIELESHVLFGSPVNAIGTTEINPNYKKFEAGEKIDKVGVKKKTAKIKNTKRQRMHDIKKPGEKHCRRCNIETETERFAHYEGFRKHEYGKGIGVKCDDNLTAWLCQECTDIMDKKPDKTVLGYPEFKHSEEWLHLIIKSHLI